MGIFVIGTAVVLVIIVSGFMFVKQQRTINRLNRILLLNEESISAFLDIAVDLQSTNLNIVSEINDIKIYNESVTEYITYSVKILDQLVAAKSSVNSNVRSKTKVKLD